MHNPSWWHHHVSRYQCYPLAINVLENPPLGLVWLIVPWKLSFMIPTAMFDFQRVYPMTIFDIPMMVDIYLWHARWFPWFPILTYIWGYPKMLGFHGCPIVFLWFSWFSHGFPIWFSHDRRLPGATRQLSVDPSGRPKSCCFTSRVSSWGTQVISWNRVCYGKTAQNNPIPCSY